MATQNLNHLDKRMPTLLILIFISLLFFIKYFNSYDEYQHLYMRDTNFTINDNLFENNHTPYNQLNRNQYLYLSNNSITPTTINNLSFEGNNTRQIQQNDSKNIGLNCSLYLIKNPSPNYETYHFYHDIECIMAAFHHQLAWNVSVADCNNITFIVSEKFNYTQSRYFHSELFNFKIIETGQFKHYMKKKKNRYKCLNGNQYRYRLVQFRTFIITKWKLNNKYNLGYKNKTFYKDYGDILVINRKPENHRSIYNVGELMNRLNKEYMNTQHNVKLVYFENISLIKQYETMLNASVIITPHGATETSLFLVNHRLINLIKIIELCPPYLHCMFKCNKRKQNCYQLNRISLCPHFYKNVYRYLKIYGIAREDMQLGDCHNYWKYHKWEIYYNTKRNFVYDFKNIISFKVNTDDVMNSINEKYSYYKQKIVIDVGRFNESEYNFYASNLSLVSIDKYEGFDLYA